jgi:hypothetical protein
LCSPDQAHNFSSAKINSFETIPVGGTGLNLSLKFIGMYHHGNSLLGVESCVALACQTFQCFLGLINAALADEPPRRFWTKIYADD